MTQLPGPSCTHSSQRRGAGSSPWSRSRQQPKCSGLSCETSTPGRPEAWWSPRTGPLQSPLVSSCCRYRTALRRRRITHNLEEENRGNEGESKHMFTDCLLTGSFGHIDISVLFCLVIISPSDLLYSLLTSSKIWDICYTHAPLLL